MVTITVTVSDIIVLIRAGIPAIIVLIRAGIQVTVTVVNLTRTRSRLSLEGSESDPDSTMIGVIHWHTDHNSCAGRV
jgi:hypothetical protein